MPPRYRLPSRCQRVRETLLRHLVAPGTADALELADDVVRDAAGEIVAATLTAPDGRRFPARDGIPRFVEHTDTGQAQTETSFGYKGGQAEAFEWADTQAWAHAWLVERYGFADAAEPRSFFASPRPVMDAGGGNASRRLVMDAGCGNAYTARLWLEPGWTGGAPVEWIGVDISTAVDVARQRLAGIEGLHFVQADLLALPFRAGAFDTAFSEGVLHHTPSTERALRSVVDVVEPGGEILAYVYRQKGPIREFTDDYLRDVLAPLDPEEARARLRPLTALAESLSTAGATVTVPAAIAELG